jgi:hypothetical protein
MLGKEFTAFGRLCIGSRLQIAGSIVQLDTIQIARRECSLSYEAHVAHGTGSAALIADASAQWVLLSDVYHYVLAQSPSPEFAKNAIAAARKNGQLRLRAERLEHEARPGLRLTPGEQVAEILPERKSDEPILATDKFGSWDWERSRATRTDRISKSLFEYTNIECNRDDVLKLWPPAKTVVTGRAATMAARPPGITRLVWAVVLKLDEIETETPTIFALPQRQLAEKLQNWLSRPVSVRTLQKALAVRRNRDGRP